MVGAWTQVSLPREALVQRCCEVMGRQYRPKEGEAEAGLGDSFPEGGGGRRGGSRDGSRGVLGTTADALGEKAAGYDSGEEVSGSRHPVPSIVHRVSLSTIEYH